MKKVSLCTFTLSLIASSAVLANIPPAPAACCPKAFQGFHIGGNLGYDVGWGKQRVNLARAIGTNNSVKNTLGIRGIAGGIGTGYLHRLKQWGLGIAFDAIWSNAKGRFTNNINGIPDTLFGKLQLKNSLELYGKLGYVLCGEQAMPFLGLGWANSKWENYTGRTAVFVGSPKKFGVESKKRYNSLLWKAGVDFLLTKHLIAGMEYTGMNGNRKGFTSRDSFSGDVITSSFRPQINRFSLTLRLVY